MPLNANQTTIKLYGSGTQNTLPDTGTLNGRELYVNTYNTWKTVPFDEAAPTSGGEGFEDTDIHLKGTVQYTEGGTQIRPLTFIIDEIVDGVVTKISTIDPGAWTTKATTLTGTASIPGASGTGVSVTITYEENPSIADGGGLYVGDAVVTDQAVKLSGSLASQDANNVNIQGGVIRNTLLEGVTLLADENSETTLTGAELVNAKLSGDQTTIDAATLTNITINSGSIGSMGNTIENIYVAPESRQPTTLTQGVLMVDVDGKVFVSNRPYVERLTTSEHLLVKGGLQVGGDNFNSITGSIVAQNNITAFG